MLGGFKEGTGMAQELQQGTDQMMSPRWSIFPSARPQLRVYVTVTLSDGYVSAFSAQFSVMLFSDLFYDGKVKFKAVMAFLPRV